MVTDDEKAFFPPIKKYLPSMDLYRCTNHLDRDIEAALRKLGDTDNLLVAWYKTDVKFLLDQDSLTDYYEELHSQYLGEHKAWSQVNTSLMELLCITKSCM